MILAWACVCDQLQGRRVMMCASVRDWQEIVSGSTCLGIADCSRVFVCVCVSICVCVCVCVRLYTCVCIWQEWSHLNQSTASLRNAKHPDGTLIVALISFQNFNLSHRSNSVIEDYANL